ncbi:MAG TPA: hypothetical protein VGJ77_20130 [Gaiellaceae bacterium]
MSVVFDLGAGQARLGTTVVPIAAAGRNGELRVGGRRGPVLRPLAFGERTRVVAGVRHTSDPREAVAAAVAAAALVHRGRLESRVQDVVALALAGAGETAPPFGETALVVARAAGWDYARLMDADAAEVDRLARQLGARPLRSGWSRFVLAGDAAGELDAIRRELAQELLDRGDEAPIDLEDAVGVPEAPPSPAGAGDEWTFPSRTAASGAAGVEWPTASSADASPPRRRRRDPQLAPAAARAAADAGAGATPEGQTRAASAADTSGPAASRVRPGTRPETTRSSEPRLGSDPRLPAFRFDGSRAAGTPLRGRDRPSDLGEQVPLRIGPPSAMVSESAGSVRAPSAGGSAAAASVGPGRSAGAASAPARGRWAAATAAPVDSAPTGAALGPARTASVAWGAPEPALPLVPPRAQPFVLPARGARAWAEAGSVDAPTAPSPDAGPARADDVAELLAAALHDECDLRGIDR